MKSLSEVEPPIRRFFPDHADRRRRVYVTISFFPGTGSHFHVEIREEHNYAYDARTARWIAPADDPAGEGRVRFMKFNRESTARRWVQQTFEEEFSDETHELVFHGDVTSRWFYPEGD
ncbi:MAG: hypothetical protein ACLFUM_06725 [Spirochaetaceae bacterium]